MARNIIMPKLGLTMTQGRITRWLKKEGEQIKVGEPVAEIETDKINAEVESTLNGYILKILAQEGEEVAITVPICIVGENNTLETSQVDNLTNNEETKVETVTTGRIFITPIAKRLAAENRLGYKTIKGNGPLGRIVKADVLKAVDSVEAGSNIVIADTANSSRAKISPLARTMAQENGIDISKITGTGPEGRIVKEDIQAAMHEKTSIKTVMAEPIVAEPVLETVQVHNETLAGGRRVPLSGMRKIIAQRLTQSKHDTPHVYFKVNVDATRIIELKNQISDLVKDKTGKKLSINEVIIRAVASALEAFPDVNVSLVDNEIIYHDNINIGMAVSVEKGLVVPVINDANKMSLSEINKIAGELAMKAKDGKLNMDEMSGGTFTISNLGAYGIDEFSAIINLPESAILAVGAAAEAPCVENGQVVIKTRMNLTLSVDHRVIDGALAARFMKKLKEFLENPYLLLI